jgi:hypothetical protein
MPVINAKTPCHVFAVETGGLALLSCKSYEAAAQGVTVIVAVVATEAAPAAVD